MKVLFTETRVVDDFRKGTLNEERFEKGKSYDLPEPSAAHWISRGAAVVDSAEAKAELKKADAEAKAAEKAAAKAAADDAGA